MSKVDQDLATCYHEAAHAVFAVRVVGGFVRYVDVEERYCATRLYVSDGYAGSWRRALYTLVGRFAERLEIWGEVRPDSWEDFWEAARIEQEEMLEQDRGDTSDLIELLYEMGDPEEEYGIVIRDTEKQVRRLWSEITAVAEALRRQRRLNGVEVIQVIETAQGGGVDA